MRLLLLGCTGLVGRELVPQLLAEGHTLTIVSRQQRQLAGVTCLQSDPSRPESWAAGSALQQALEQAEGVVNLAGEPIAEQRWTPAHLEVLHRSRIDTTRHLVAAINASDAPPQVLVSASAVGYYGTSESASFNEDSPAGSDVLAKLCEQWEAAAKQVNASTRLVITRIGIVLAPDGGALGKMLPIFRAGFGGPIGSGQQWMSWIDRSDLCRVFSQSLENSSYSGVFNLVAPKPVKMSRFCSQLGSTLSRPSLLPVPPFLLKLLLGDGASVVLDGQQVLPSRLQNVGFTFKYPDLASSLAHLLLDQ